MPEVQVNQLRDACPRCGLAVPQAEQSISVHRGVRNFFAHERSGGVAQIGATALHPARGETPSEVKLAGRRLQLSTEGCLER